MPLIDVRDLERTFVVRRRRAGRRRRAATGAGRPRPHVRHRGRRDGRLHRPERRREVDHDQDADRHPGARPAGTVRVAGLDPQPRPGRAGAPDRRRLRPAHHAVVGPAAARLLRPAPEDVPDRPGAPPREPRPIRRAARPRRPARHPGPPAQPRPADARRHHRRAAARPRDRSTSTSRPSASTWSARAGCASSCAPQRRARHHAPAHHPRPPGHRGALPPGDRHRPRHRGLRRHAGRAAPAGRVRRAPWSSTWSTRAPPIAVARGDGPPGRGAAPVAVASRPTRSAAPIVAAVAAAYDVADLSIQEPDIEDVIRELYSRWPARSARRPGPATSGSGSARPGRRRRSRPARSSASRRRANPIPIASRAARCSQAIPTSRCAERSSITPSV